MPVKIFFCYAHEDEPLLNKLKTHLKPLQRQGLIDVWHDRDISAGTEWEQEINEHLNSAQIILLMVSSDFMDSDYCYSIEMKRAIERHERGEARVIPVILRPAHWQVVLGKLQALPTDARPITDPNWYNLDRALYDVTEGIYKLVTTLLAQRSKEQSEDTSNSNSLLSKHLLESTLEIKQDSHSNLSKVRKLFVVTSGTIAANVGQELIRQIEEHPKSELQVLVRSLDTARLNTRHKIRDSDWYHMTIDQRHMKAVYQARSRNLYLSSMLYDDLLPFTTGVGASRIRYNGASALIVNHDQIKRWLSSSISTLSRSTKGDTAVSFAAIISSVGATGSGSIQRLVELLADAASDATIETPINCDIFIMLPESEGVDELGLANTFALFAELAAARLARKTTDQEYFQGRIILVGWGKTRSLTSIAQLEEATATLVRLIKDPITDFAAAYENSRADHHILRQLDDVTLLPTQLSSVTAVTISLGNLEEQIVERDTANLVTHLVSGNEGSNHTNLDLFSDTLSHSMPGETAEEKYLGLIDHLSLNLRLQTRKPTFDSEASGRGIPDPKAWLQQRWVADRSTIDQNLEFLRGEGTRLVRELVKLWSELQLKGITTSSETSLSSLNGSYQRLIKTLDQILRTAREPLAMRASNNDVTRSLNALNVQSRGGDVPRKENDRERPGLIRSALDRIRKNIEDYLEQRMNPIAIELLQELLFEANRAQRDLTIVLTRLDMHRQSIEVVSTQHFSLGSDHMLKIPALSSDHSDTQESEIDSYYKQVSLFAPREKKRPPDSGGVATESDPYVEFRRWLGNDPERVEQLFQGDIERLRQMAREYVQKFVADEVRKYSVLDILLRENGVKLRERLREAAAVSYPLVNLNEIFTPEEHKEKLYLCAYWGDNDQKRGKLQEAIYETFGRGSCILIPTKDPTEIVVFSYIDGLSMATIRDLTGRCFDAFLRQRKRWLDQRKDNPTQNIGIPIYSGKDAEEQVQEHNIICKLNIAAKRDLSPFYILPEVINCV